MKMPTLQRSGRAAENPPGLVAPARADRRTATLIPRLKSGDIAVIDHVDLDRGTAQRLVDAEVGAVVNASPMISGRYANLGPQVLADAGIVIIDGVGDDGFRALRDGSTLRLHDGRVYDGQQLLATGRVVDAAVVAADMASARDGLASQLENFTHNSAELLRREEDLLLHRRGFPKTATDFEGRPVVVLVKSHDWAAELDGIKTWLAEQRPILVAVDQGADALLANGLRPDVVVVTGDVADSDLPSLEAMRAAKDVVVRFGAGAAGPDKRERFERTGVKPQLLGSGATTEDVALLLANAGEASLIVGVGLHATLDEFLDRQHSGLASNYLTRLALGPKLVDAAAIPALYSGRVRPWHLFVVLLACLMALSTAIGVTPLGQEWANTAGDWTAEQIRRLIDYVQGLL